MLTNGVLALMAFSLGDTDTLYGELGLFVDIRLRHEIHISDCTCHVHIYDGERCRPQLTFQVLLYTDKRWESLADSLACRTGSLGVSL